MSLIGTGVIKVATLSAHRMQNEEGTAFLHLMFWVDDGRPQHPRVVNQGIGQDRYFFHSIGDAVDATAHLFTPEETVRGDFLTALIGRSVTFEYADDTRNHFKLASLKVLL